MSKDATPSIQLGTSLPESLAPARISSPEPPPHPVLAFPHPLIADGIFEFRYSARLADAIEGLLKLGKPIPAIPRQAAAVEYVEQPLGTAELTRAYAEGYDAAWSKAHATVAELQTATRTYEDIIGQAVDRAQTFHPKLSEADASRVSELTKMAKAIPESTHIVRTPFGTTCSAQRQAALECFKTQKADTRVCAPLLEDFSRCVALVRASIPKSAPS